jgi:hypothetical protein
MKPKGRRQVDLRKNNGPFINCILKRPRGGAVWGSNPFKKWIAQLGPSVSAKAWLSNRPEPVLNTMSWKCRPVVNLDHSSSAFWTFLPTKRGRARLGRLLAAPALTRGRVVPRQAP